MRRLFDLRLVLTVLASSAVLSAQPAPARVMTPAETPQQQQPAPQQPGAPPQPGQPGQPAPAGQPAAQQPNAPPTNAPRLTDNGAFMMNNASLTEMIDLLAQRLKINYIIDPAVRG